VNLRGPSDGNPCLEVHLAATFAHGHRQITVDGFYDGDVHYRVRSVPDTLGQWAHTTRSIAERLDGVTATFICTDPSVGNHGPVRVGQHIPFCLCRWRRSPLVWHDLLRVGPPGRPDGTADTENPARRAVQQDADWGPPLRTAIEGGGAPGAISSSRGSVDGGCMPGLADRLARRRGRCRQQGRRRGDSRFPGASAGCATTTARKAA